jgi:DNA-binding HxlR family transcriptional regulator
LSVQTTKKEEFQRLRARAEDELDLISAPTKLFHPYRIVIMKALKLHGNVEFRQLKPNLPRITDGNLASHLGVLEKSGYVRCHKEVENRKLRTSYEITEKGRKDFEKLTNSLKKVIGNESNI